MAEGHLAIDVLNLDCRVRRLEQTLERKLMRREQDSFDLTNEEFIELYRINPQLAADLIDTLQPSLQRVLTAVRFYATGYYQRPVGDQCDISLSQSSVSRCIRDVTNAINERLLKPWVQFPMTPEDRQRAASQFVTARQPFQGAIGAIDCTHVALFGPREHQVAYVNHHGYHSLNVQAICDPNLTILNINARYPGARNDTYIWNTSSVRRIMEREYNRGERTFLIGDQGYPLEPRLTPLPNEREETQRFNYNQSLCSARNCIERLFGALRSTWRCLSKHRVLQYEPGMAGKIVNACAVLHNMRIDFGLQPDMYEDPNEYVINIPNMANMDDDDDNNLPLLALARRIQDRLIHA
ncbi:putative nuclease HARBI1 [Neodiprion pinetum]|uniref:putative nuclease HARBI1 n=1 Tax=Neodiprion pinetum TaxID=441929 RepID=UPI001EDF54F1|nr:putative nuclease HARBI1 [Neodiprion pinetum]